MFKGLFTTPAKSTDAYNTAGLAGVIGWIDSSDLTSASGHYDFKVLETFIKSLPEGVPFTLNIRYGSFCPAYIAQTLQGINLKIAPKYHAPEATVFYPKTWTSEWTAWCLNLLDAVHDWLDTQGYLDRVLAVCGVHQSWLDGDSLQFPWQNTTPADQDANVQAFIDGGFTPELALNECASYLRYVSYLFPNTDVLFAPRDAQGGQFMPPVGSNGVRLEHPAPDAIKPFITLNGSFKTNFIYCSVGRPGQTGLPSIYAEAAAAGCAIGGQFIVPPWPKTAAELIDAAEVAIKAGCTSLQFHGDQVTAFPEAVTQIEALLTTSKV